LKCDAEVVHGKLRVLLVLINLLVCKMINLERVRMLDDIKRVKYFYYKGKNVLNGSSLKQKRIGKFYIQTWKYFDLKG
jgi:hypothetical protein